MKINFFNSKALIYLLTFLGSAPLNSDCSEILRNIKDAVLSADNVLSGVIENVKKARHSLKDVQDVVEAAMQEDCKFTCADGFTVIPNPNHVPSSNGCGSLGLQIESDNLPVGATECCNAHDLCYDMCNAGKEKCDLDFKQCLYRTCDSIQKSAMQFSHKGCRVAAKLMFTSIDALGCKSYLDAQEKACYCASKPQKEYIPGGMWQNYIMWGYPQFNFGRIPPYI